MLKKPILILLSVILIFCTNISVDNIQALSTQNTDVISTVSSPYDGSLKEKNYVGLQTDYSIIRLKTYTAEITLYNTIYSGILNYLDKIDVSSFNTTTKNVFNTLQTVLNDHPELFYVNTSGVRVSYSTYAISLSMSYIYPKDQCKTMATQLNEKVNSIIQSTITTDMTEFQKEIALHDYIVKNTTYDTINYDNQSLTWEDYSAWGALINNTCVCEGYSKSFKLLLSKVGINSLIVVSDSMNHAWNIVNIDGINYQVDTTWDDPVPETNRVSYYFFNITDDQISDSNHQHDWIKTNYPACTNTKYDKLMKIGSSSSYYKRNGNKVYYFNTADSTSLYSMNIDGTSIQKINSTIRGYDPEVFGNNLYYRSIYNFNLYKVSLTGTNNTKLNDYEIYNLYVKDGLLHVKTNGYNSTTEAIINIIEKGDINKDGFVDIKDFGVITGYYNQVISTTVDSSMDLNGDKLIDIYDLTIISKKIH